MILLIIHYLLAILCSISVIRLFITDYKRQRETDDEKALQLEQKQSSILFDILVIIALSLFF